MSNARENVNLLTSTDWDIATLRLASWGSGAVPAQVILKTNHAAGDGGGVFRYDASDTTTADNGGTVIVDAAGNRWKRQFKGASKVSWWGSTSAALQSAVNSGAKQISFDVTINPFATKVTISTPLSLEGPVTAILGGIGYILVDTNIDVFDITSDNVHISGLYIDHYNNGCCFDFNQQVGCSLTNITIKAFSASATVDTIYFAGSFMRMANVGVSNESTSRWAINCDRKAGVINIAPTLTEVGMGGTGKGMIIQSSDASPRPEGVYLDTCRSLLTGGYHLEVREVLGLRLDNCELNGGWGVYLNPAAQKIDDVTFSGGWLDATGVSKNGISVNPAAAGEVVNLVLTGVTFLGCTDSGVNAGPKLANATIQGCKFVSNLVGLSLDQATRIVVQGCQFAFNTFDWALTDGASGGPFIFDGNMYDGLGSHVYTATNTEKFTFANERGKNTSRTVSASTGTISSGSSVSLAIPHGLITTPSLDKINGLTVRVVSGSFTSISATVQSADATNINIVIDYVYVSSGVLRATVNCSI